MDLEDHHIRQSPVATSFSSQQSLIRLFSRISQGIPHDAHDAPVADEEFDFDYDDLPCTYHYSSIRKPNTIDNNDKNEG